MIKKMANQLMVSPVLFALVCIAGYGLGCAFGQETRPAENVSNAESTRLALTVLQKAAAGRSLELSTTPTSAANVFCYDAGIVAKDPQSSLVYEYSVTVVRDRDKVACLVRRPDGAITQYFADDIGIGLSDSQPGAIWRIRGGSLESNVKIAIDRISFQLIKFTPEGNQRKVDMDLSGLENESLGTLKSAAFDSVKNVITFKKEHSVGFISFSRPDHPNGFPIQEYVSESNTGNLLDVRIRHVGRLSDDEMRFLRDSKEIDGNLVDLGLAVDDTERSMPLLTMDSSSSQFLEASANLKLVIFGSLLPDGLENRLRDLPPTRPTRVSPIDAAADSLVRAVASTAQMRYSTKATSKLKEFAFQLDFIVETPGAFRVKRMFCARRNDRAAVAYTDPQLNLLSYNTDGLSLAVDQSHPGGLVIVRNCSPSFGVSTRNTGTQLRTNIVHGAESTSIDFDFGSWVSALAHGVRWIALDPNAPIYTVRDGDVLWQLTLSPGEEGKQGPVVGCRLFDTQQFPKAMITAVVVPSNMQTVLDFPAITTESVSKLGVPVREISEWNDEIPSWLMTTPTPLTPDEIRASQKLMEFVSERE